MNKFFTKQRAGFSVIETIFYIAFFALLSLLVIQTLLTMTKSFKQTAIEGDFLRSLHIMERISREIKQATSINTISSTDLILNTKDSAGADKTIQFQLSGTNIRLVNNGAFTGNINSDDIVVTALSFTEVSTAVGDAVKVSLSVRSANDTTGRVETLYDTVTLRGMY